MEGLKLPTGNLGAGNCVTKVLNLQCCDEINNLIKVSIHKPQKRYQTQDDTKGK